MQPSLTKQLLVNADGKQGPAACAGSGSGSSGAGQGRAGQGRAGQGRAGQGRAGQGRAGQGRAGQGRAGQGRAGQGRAGQGRAGQGRRTALRKTAASACMVFCRLRRMSATDCGPAALRTLSKRAIVSAPASLGSSGWLAPGLPSSAAQIKDKTHNQIASSYKTFANTPITTPVDSN